MRHSSGAARHPFPWQQRHAEQLSRQSSAREPTRRGSDKDVLPPASQQRSKLLRAELLVGEGGGAPYAAADLPFGKRRRSSVCFSALDAGLSQHISVDMFCHVSHMLVFNMTVHNMHATVLACTHTNSLYSVLGLGYPHIGIKVNTPPWCRRMISFRFLGYTTKSNFLKSLYQ